MESHTDTVIDVNRWVDRQNLTRQQARGTKRADRGIIRRSDVATPTMPVLDSCDVLVVGGGPAGLSAALASKRCLQKSGRVILMDRFNCFGGTITTVGMETVGWYRYEGTQDCEGAIGIEFERLAQRLGKGRKFAFNDSQCLDAENFKKIADDLVLEAGIVPLLHCFCVDVEMDDGRIRSVITESKSGRCKININRGGVVIDCTGDADVAYLSNCLVSLISKEESLGLTSVFNCSNVNVNKFFDKLETRHYKDWGDEWVARMNGSDAELPSPYVELTDDPDVAQASDDRGHPTNIVGTWSSMDATAGEATNLNLVHMRGFSPLDVRDLTQAEILGRRQTDVALTELQKKLPGFENAKIRNHSMTVGVRDSRKIVGEYNLTLQDCTSQARFHDAIGVFPEFLDGYAILILPTSGRYFHVPLRALIPKQVNDGPKVPGNLLVGGRCIAGDNGSHAAMRNMMACTVSGGGAGVAAAVYTQMVAGGMRDTPLQTLSREHLYIERIQGELKRQGVRLLFENKSSSSPSKL